MQIIQTIVFCTAIFLSIIGQGYLFNKITKIENSSLFNLFINGTILIIFFSLLLNFFLPLSLFITSSILVITLLIGIHYFIFYNDKNSYLHSIIIILFSSLIIFKSYPYNDYTLYHLPYLELLNNNKIIFGLSNLHFRLGHTSIFQNISAFFYNPIMLLDSYVFYTPLLISTLLIFGFDKLRNTNKTSILIVVFICLIYFLIHANRYGSLGNDYPSHGLALTLFVLLLSTDIKNSIKKINLKFYQICSISLICFLSKFSLLLIFIFPIIFLFKNYKYLSLNKSYFLIFFSCFIFFLIKNFINTSCIIFPMHSSCIETSWLPNKYSENSSAYVSVVSEAAVKDYSNSGMFYGHPVIDNFVESEQKNNIFQFNKLSEVEKTVFNNIARYKFYSKFKNWITHYYNNYFQNVILNKTIPFISFILLVNILFILITRPPKKVFNYSNVIKNPFFYLNLINLFFLLIWFLKFPIIRYGLSFVLIFISFLSAFILYFFVIDKIKFKNTLIVLVCVFFSFSIIENLVRIYQFSEKSNFSNNIVPIEKIKITKNKLSNGFEINLTDTVCSSTKKLCLNSGDLNRFETEFTIYNKDNYIYILNKNKL